ncbi:MAG: inositol monophosphatase family protein, partial [Victivallaceae bacterium]
TAPYSAGFPAWGISIGFMEKGILKEGAIYLPPQDELIITDGEQVWRCHGLTSGGELEPMQFATQPFNSAGIISISQKSAKYGKIDLPNQVFAWSGCVASFYYLFTGKLMAYITSLKLWDIAGAIPIMERSGLIGRTLDGKTINNKVVNGCFDLDAASKCRWALRGYAVIGDSEETINHIINHISLPEN